MSLTDRVTVIDGKDSFEIWVSQRKLKTGALPSVPEMVERFFSNRWTFADCFSVYLIASKTGNSAMEFYQEESDVTSRPPASLALIAGTVLQAAIMGLPEDEATVDLSKLRQETRDGD